MLRFGLVCLCAVVGSACSRPQIEVIYVDIPDEPKAPEQPDKPAQPSGPTLVDVAHPRELRGAWVATVYGLNWPRDPSASAAFKEQELRGLITTLASRGVNTVFFQVRPESDALYASTLEPWSRFLTGTQGQDPGFDPLTTAIEAAHQNGIELHAWLNPYRGLVSATTTATQNHVTHTLAADAIDYDGMVWMNPASTQVRAHVIDVVTDIVSRYDVDGIHFDDYFYPYPAASSFPDDASFDAYVAGGGNSSKGDWRRANVNSLIADVSAILKASPAVRFGVSPFGIYRDGVPAGIHGLDAFDEISCDPVTWIDNDWVDYLAPQLYWPTTQTAQAFGTLLPWWSSLPDGDGRFVVAGLNLSELGSDSAWTLDEFRNQLAIVRAHDGAKGASLYNASPLLNDQDGVGDLFASELWSTPALPPPVVIDPRVPAPPRVVHDGDQLLLVALDVGDRAFALYQEVSGTFELAQLVPASTASLTLLPGRYAISAVGKNDRESQGVVVVVEP